MLDAAIRTGYHRPLPLGRLEEDFEQIAHAAESMVRPSVTLPVSASTGTPASM